MIWKIPIGYVYLTRSTDFNPNRSGYHILVRGVPEFLILTASIIRIVIIGEPWHISLIYTAESFPGKTMTAGIGIVAFKVPTS